jgi:hypothetical protein
LLRAVRFWLFLGIIVLASRSAFAEATFFDESRAADAVGKILDRAGHPTKVLSVEIRPRELTVELQATDNPRHIDAYTIRAAGGISGPQPVAVDPADLDTKLFALTPADLAIVPKLAATAIKEAKLEDAASVERIELRRSGTGTPQWSIDVSSGRERATIYTNLSGEITRADLSGTHRAQAVDYQKGGPALDEIVATIGDTLGKDAVLKEVSVSERFVFVDAVDPDHSERIAAFRANINGVQRWGEASPGRPGALPPGRFAVGDVDWQALPKLIDAARGHLNLPAGKINRITVAKPDHGLGPAIEWEIGVEAVDDSSVSGWATFDPNGNWLHTSFPPGREPAYDMFDPANAMAAVDTIARRFGEHVSLLELRFRGSELLLEVADRHQPPAAIEFSYGAGGLTRGLAAVDDRKVAADWFFDLAPVRPMVEHWRQLQQDTLTRLALPDGKIDMIAISKQKRLLPQNDLVLVVVRASSGERRGGVVYGLDGKMLDIEKP